MMPVELSDAAAADLTAIWNYGAERFGADMADDYVRGFAAPLALIAEHPGIGAIHDRVRPPIRSLPHRSHRIYYDVLIDQVMVQRVLHKAADIERWL